MVKDSFFVGGGGGSKRKSVNGSSGSGGGGMIRKSSGGGAGASQRGKFVVKKKPVGATKTAAAGSSSRAGGGASGTAAVFKRKRMRDEYDDEEDDRSNINGKDDDHDDDDDDEAGLGAVDDMDLEGDDRRRAREREIDENEEEDQELKETPAQKRLRLAKKYLNKIREESANKLAPGEFDAKDLDRDIIADRLRDEALEAKGKLFHKVAHNYKDIDLSDTSRIQTFKSNKKPHQESITGLAVSIVSKSATSTLSTPQVYIYSVSKDASLVKWDFFTGKPLSIMEGATKRTKKATKRFGDKRLKAEQGHHDEILTIAASSDGAFIATGGRDKVIYVWSVETGARVGTFTQHRDAVSGLAFRSKVNQLYSCSFDRTVKLWNIDEMSYIETLFGHQDQIQCIDTISNERCVTAGSRDRTVRLWKIVEESQLIFRGGGGGEVNDVIAGTLLPTEIEEAKKEAKKTGGNAFGTCIDVVAMINEETFVSGTDGGAISLWNIGRKKPLFTKLRCHGPIAPTHVPPEQTAFDDSTCHWITALATLRFSDVFASGSCDGFVRLWKLSDDKRTFSALNSVPIIGFINSLQFFESPETSTLETTQDQESATAEDQEMIDAGVGGLKSRNLAVRRAAAMTFTSNKNTQASKVLYLAVGTGQEHRLGRWWRVKETRNEVKIVKLG